MNTTFPWATHVSYALLGQAVEIDVEPPTPESILAALDGTGWPKTRIASVARQRLDHGESWPFPVAPQVVKAAGAARWHAVMGEIVESLGVSIEHRAPSSRSTLDSDETRLLADVPPHW